MRIQQQFRAAFAAVAAALLTALAIFIGMNHRVEKVEGLRRWASEVVRLVFDCNVLGSESILQDNARSREQYASTSAALQQRIDAAPDAPLVHRFLPEIAAAKNRLDQIFREASPNAEGTLERENFELYAMLVSQWMLQTRSLLEAARALRLEASAESSRARRLALWSVSASILLVCAITGLTFFKLNKSLVQPLHELSAGARRIGGGDLTVQLPADSRNEIGMVANSFNDMTAQLAARQRELQEKLRDLEAFSYSVAHDLKAPLRSIVGYGSLLEADCADRLGSDGSAYLKSMRASAIQMSSLIDDLLEFGQLTHQQFEIRPIPVRPICEQLLAEMHEEITERKASVTYNGDSPLILANEVLLKQILRNLVSNAIKFVPKDVSPLVQINAQQNGAVARIEVKDNGIGIAPEHQQLIFGLFNRLHSFNDYPGTGVGLALVQKSVERLHGRVGVTSAPGQGSTFWVQLKQHTDPIAS